MPRGDRNKSPIHHCGADYIIWSFVITEFIKIHFENGVLPKPVLLVWPVLQMTQSKGFCYFLIFAIDFASNGSK